ncbi:MAG: nicotinate-nucleotide adenylyltransferase [Metamycoplasmataceae bacterium]
MKIAIYGGAFNPIHKGHIKIAKYAIETLGLDRLIFVPSYKGPFKKDLELVPGNDRLNMIELVLEDKMDVSSFEINRKSVSYTIDTVKYFKKKYKDDELFLIIGSDNLAKLNKWKNIDDIATLAKIVVFKREENFSKINLKKYNCMLMENECFEESSSRFLSGSYKDVESKVKHYIGQHKFYFNEIAKNTLSVERYKHSLYAAKYGVEIAKNLKLDAKKAYYACLMHDITKEWDVEKQRAFLTHFLVDEKNLKDYELHQISGSIWLRKFFAINDFEMTNAVARHTSLALELTTMDKVVYMADKLCPGRKWDGIQTIRKLVFENFDLAFAMTVEKSMELVLKKGISLTEKQKEIYNKWSKLED